MVARGASLCSVHVGVGGGPTSAITVSSVARDRQTGGAQLDGGEEPARLRPHSRASRGARDDRTADVAVTRHARSARHTRWDRESRGRRSRQSG